MSPTQTARRRESRPARPNSPAGGTTPAAPTTQRVTPSAATHVASATTNQPGTQRPADKATSRGGVTIEGRDPTQPCRGWCPCGWNGTETTSYPHARAEWKEHRHRDHDDDH
jgi:hypothetical protein